MSSSPAMDRLVASLKRLSGIGEKSATRLAYFLLSAPEDLSRELSESIARLQRDTVVCETCYTLSDRTPCPVCATVDRDRTVVCVVECLVFAPHPGHEAYDVKKLPYRNCST